MKNSEMLFSIIIPVYNVEKYIRETLLSVYEQEFETSKFEVIVVNDETPDDSMRIVSEFAQKYENLHVINQENQGLSGARNSGLQMARGEYIWFVDSDDTIAENSLNYIESIVRANKADIYAFDLIRVDESSGVERKEPVVLKPRYSYCYDRFLPINRYWKKMHICPAQRFLYSKKFLDENNLAFFPGIFHEDEEFDVRAMVKAKKIFLSNQPVYRYLVRSSGSIMSSFKMKSAWSKIQIMKNFIQEGNNTANYKKRGVYFDRVFENAVWLLSTNLTIHKDYAAFVSQHKRFLKKWAIIAFFKSMSYISVGKILKLVRVIV